MTDDFIRELQVSWKAQEVRAPAVVARLRRGRWTPHLILGLELLHGLVGLAFGAGFLWLALASEPLELMFSLVSHRPPPGEAVAEVHAVARPVFLLAAAVLLVVQPLFTWRLVAARRASLRWEGETPEGVLRTGARLAAASLEANRIGRWALWLLLAFAASFWGFVVFGSYPVLVAAIQTAAYLAGVGATWTWLELRRERLTREIETCLKLLEEYAAAGEGGG